MTQNRTEEEKINALLRDLKTLWLGYQGEDRARMFKQLVYVFRYIPPIKLDGMARQYTKEEALLTFEALFDRGK